MKYPLIAMFALACAGTPGAKTSGDTGGASGDCTQFTFDGPVKITSISASCDGEDINYAIETTGITADGGVWAVEGSTQPWDENQPVESFEFDNCGHYDHLAKQIKPGEYPDYDYGHVSTFDCDKINDDGYMTYAFWVYDDKGNVADCVVAGKNPTGARDGDFSPYLGAGPDIDLGQCHTGVDLSR